MSFRNKLSQRINMDDIHEITHMTQGNNKKKEELYNLLFDEENIVELDSDKKVAMVSNLLVVLCADESAQPVLNTGTLYQ